MITIDLSVPHKKERLTSTQFLIMWICIFFGVAILLAVGLVLQWRYLNSLDSEVARLSTMRDSLEEVNSELVYYENLRNYCKTILDETERSKARLDEDMNIMRVLMNDLQSGMRLEGFEISEDTVTARILSPSHLKVQRYVEALSKSDLFSEYRSESQGSRDGSVAHRLILRKR